eukprot:Skav204180  [mRNA]  locus=scaffold903:662694:667427:+ [translate_table: standard]
MIPIQEAERQVKYPRCHQEVQRAASVSHSPSATSRIMTSSFCDECMRYSMLPLCTTYIEVDSSPGRNTTSSGA